jgi:hypothetical protein
MINDIPVKSLASRCQAENAAKLSNQASPAVSGICGMRFADQHQLAGIRHRQRPQHDSVYHRKHRCGCADAKGQQE